jgi:hypothetical protein
MESLFILLLPYIIGSALVPVQNIINILLLKNPRQGLLKAAAYVGGMTVLRLLQGLIFGLIFRSESSGSKSPVALTLQLVLGILLLITAFKQWRNEEDPDAPPPKWMTTLDRLTPLKAFGFGFVILMISGKAWVFTLGAISIIDSAQPGLAAGAMAYLLFVLLAESLLLAALLFRAILPKNSVALLEQASTWLARNNRPIMIAVSLVFGLLFLYQGVSGLINL